MVSAMTKTDRLMQDPLLKKMSKEEIKRVIKSPEVRIVLERLSYKHELGIPEVTKALLEGLQKEALKAIEDVPT